ncbi:hypothetical protein GCM10009804_15850 [Kribbella hippodromi]|uniref:Alginate lyase domain-containing protein n=1 Tax=Kribbella hippodromi TaxID=434347 RepID=A0ABN2CP40_9ACTN
MARPAIAQEPGPCTVSFRSSVSAQGFVHPGVGLTEPILTNARRQIAAGQEPWTSSFRAMQQSSAAGTGVTSSNRSSTDPGKPASDAFNSQGFNGRFIADGLKSYTQAVLYVLTGAEVYRKNALDIIRIWAQMDPAKYEYFTDAHIHTGIPLNRMVSAAELLRYSSCADEAYPWTDADTQAFTHNLVVPVIETFQNDNNHFMNQHNYPLMGAMAGAIFMDDTALYQRSVEWFTVNATAKDQGFNGSIARLFRWVDHDDKTGRPIRTPHVQHAEMGRDQAHGGGDLTNAVIISRMLLAQGTKVDPGAGTISHAPNAVGPYEFLNNRILAAADYFWRFMLGYDTPWTPMAYAISPDGTIRDTYNHIADGYRGRYVTASFWEIYYHYQYALGKDVKTMAPYYAEAYAKRPGPLYSRGGVVGNSWDGSDGGGDSWLFAPAAAAGQTTRPLSNNSNLYEVEDRYTRLAGDVTTGDGYVRMAAGSKIAYLNGATDRPKLGFLVRTSGTAVLHLHTARNGRTLKRDYPVLVPNTGGKWRYVSTDGPMDDILFIGVEGTTVDLDHININAAAELTGPVFPATVADRVVGWAGAAATVDLGAQAAAGTTYTATGLPKGAALDRATGVLTWKPAGAGRWTLTIAADDGTNMAARRVTLVAAGDRTSALAVAKNGYSHQTGYESATESAYRDAVVAADHLRKSGSDAEYLTALAGVVTAVDGLRTLSPKLALDGSLDYAGLVASSTTGDRIVNLVDGDEQSGTVYPQAVNLSHTFDFGPDFRVSATKFGVQSNIFADRIANSAVFGSEDGVTWTRLTPGVTAFTQDYNTLDVAKDLQGKQFRYLKIQMIKQLPDVLYGIVRGVFELTEFHIYGERVQALCGRRSGPLHRRGEGGHRARERQAGGGAVPAAGQPSAAGQRNRRPGIE